MKIEQTKTGIQFTVKVVPGSSRTALAGEYNGMIKIKIAAPPQKGKANQCLIHFLAKHLNVSKNEIYIVSGQTNPIKHIRIEGLMKDKVLKILGE